MITDCGELHGPARGGARRVPRCLALRRAAVVPVWLSVWLFLMGDSCRDATAPPNGGRILWQTPLGRATGNQPGFDNDRVYVPSSGITALRKSDGAIVWRGGATELGLSPANIIARDNRVFAVGRSAVAFDAPSGSVLWTFTPDQQASLGTIAVDAGAVYVGTDISHRIYALDAGTGQPRWSTDIGPEWTLGGTIWGVSLSGDTVYAGATQYRSPNTYLRSGWIVALDRVTGVMLWRVSSGAGDTIRSVQSAPTIAGRFAIAADHAGNSFFAVDRFAAREVWRVSGDPTFFGAVGSPIVAGDTVLVASADLFLYAAELSTGRLLWKRQVSKGSVLHYTRCGTTIGMEALALILVTETTGDPVATLIDDYTEHVVSALTASGDTLFATSNTTAYAVDCRP